MSGFQVEEDTINSINSVYFHYSCSSWSWGWYDKKLQLLQNKVVRFVLHLGPRTSINCDILDSVKMLSVPNRVSQLRVDLV